jgi:RNA polymerase sigma-70 factor, ECF subfamily
MQTAKRVRDEWLALRCQAGDAGAFEDLCIETEPPLLYYASKLAGNRDTALDILHETWVRALAGIRKLKEPASVRSWLYTLVHSIALGQIRREKTDRRIEEVVLETREETAEDAFTADDANAIHDALDELSEKHGEILALYFLEEFSLAEIAQVCGERDSAAMVQRRVGSLTARAASCGIFFTWGDVELVKHYIDACRIDRLKEIKQIQLQLFELDTAREPSNLG